MTSATCTQQILIREKLFRVVPNQSAISSPKKRAVLFVHGFLGDAETTWKGPHASQSFPSLLATDPEITDYDVYVFQYVTKDLNPPVIDNIAAQLQFAIKEHLPHERIVLLAHSMGGLVCMRYILKLLEERKAQSIGGLLLYGTPMTGVEWAKYAQLVLQLGELEIPVVGWLLNGLLKTNKQVKALTAGSEFIDRLNGAWVLRVLNGGHAEVPAEERAWFPVRVVSGNDDWVVKESSARGFYSQIDWINVDNNHRALVKPVDHFDMAYQVARNFLKDCSGWMNPSSLLKLRSQLDGILSLHRQKCIANWQFSLSFDARECSDNANGFGLSGFRPFSAECSYSFPIRQASVKFGFAIGGISSRAIWSEDFAFLHSIRLGGLSNEQSDPIRQRLREVIKNGALGWSRLFDKVVLRVRSEHGQIWHQLQPGPVENVNEGLIRPFLLPPEASSLVGQDVVISICFRALLPTAITDYTVVFPWLCDTFTVQIAVDGKPSYLIDSQAMRGLPNLQIEREQLGTIECSSRDLILPGSFIRFEWGFENKRNTQ